MRVRALKPRWAAALREEEKLAPNTTKSDVVPKLAYESTLHAEADTLEQLVSSSKPPEVGLRLGTSIRHSRRALLAAVRHLYAHGETDAALALASRLAEEIEHSANDSPEEADPPTVRRRA